MSPGFPWRPCRHDSADAGELLDQTAHAKFGRHELPPPDSTRPYREEESVCRWRFCWPSCFPSTSISPASPAITRFI